MKISGLQKFFNRPRRKKNFKIAVDCFSDGQISSKIWLCDHFEKVVQENQKWRAVESFKISVLAGWNGLLPFLLFSRGQVPIEKIDLFDRDEGAVLTSRFINDKWSYRNNFFSHIQDLNEKNFLKAGSNLWINTSCEHFHLHDWWEAIPSGSKVILQGTDMVHEEHVTLFKDLEHFVDFYGPWKGLPFKGKLDFDYGHFKFSRFMVIGEKG